MMCASTDDVQMTYTSRDDVQMTCRQCADDMQMMYGLCGDNIS